PWLSANIVNKETNEPYFGKPYIVKSLANGLRVGILGLTTKYIPNWEKEDHIKGMQFDDPVQTAEKWVKVLKEEEKVDVVVVAYKSEEHTSELQSRFDLVCRLLLEKKKEN